MKQSKTTCELYAYLVKTDFLKYVETKLTETGIFSINIVTPI